MPKQNNINSLARQWELLRIIPSRRPGITALDLTRQIADKGYTVTKRTIERDLRDLSMLFPLVADEDSVPFRWYWFKDISSEFGGIEVTDAVSLTLAENVLKSILPISMVKMLNPKFELAHKKLAALEALPISKWSSKVRYIPESLSFKTVNIREDVLERIQSALVDGLQIKAYYDPLGRVSRTYILNPFAIIQRGVRTYLIASNPEHGQAPMQYALQRFRRVEILDSRADIPQDFDLDKYIASGAMEFGSGGTIKLQAIVSDTLASYLNEVAISEDQRINYRNGKWVLTATVRDSWQLWFWIRSQGSDIVVQKPKSLRDEIIESLQESLKTYE